MMNAIDQAKKDGDSIGGVCEVNVEGMPAGIGSYVHYDRKLDGKIAFAVQSINAFKGVVFGLGFEAARKIGSEVHEEMSWSEEKGDEHRTNNKGGLGGGMTAAMPKVVEGDMKA